MTRKNKNNHNNPLKEQSKFVFFICPRIKDKFNKSPSYGWCPMGHFFAVGFGPTFHILKRGKGEESKLRGNFLLL